MPALQGNEALAYQGHPVLQAAQSFRTGGLAITLPEGTEIFLGGRAPGTQADLRVYDEKALDDMANHGSIGFGEGYVLGLWDTANLKTLMQFFAENADGIEPYMNGKSFYKIFYFLKNKLHSSPFTGSKKNIRAHDGLGDDFYRLWLDETLTYSGALFHGDHNKSLEDAQKAKHQRIIERLAPSPQDHILEIGCGWGGFMEAAAKNGHHVTGITISPEQAGLAQQRLSEAGLDGLTEIRLQDYSEVQGQYDHVVSIGMLEHVGEEFWPEYMGKLYSVLKPSGKAMLQTIVIRDDLFEDYRKSSDFIREHIFPGGMLPSSARLRTEAEAVGFRVNDVFRFGGDYAITLEKWLENFDDHWMDISALGYSEEFIRKWRFYLTTCAAMFRVGRIDVMQVELGR